MFLHQNRPSPTSPLDFLPSSPTCPSPPSAALEPSSSDTFGPWLTVTKKYRPKKSKKQSIVTKPTVSSIDPSTNRFSSISEADTETLTDNNQISSPPLKNPSHSSYQWKQKPSGNSKTIIPCSTPSPATIKIAPSTVTNTVHLSNSTTLQSSKSACTTHNSQSVTTNSDCMDINTTLASITDQQSSESPITTTLSVDHGLQSPITSTEPSPSSSSSANCSASLPPASTSTLPAASSSLSDFSHPRVVALSQPNSLSSCSATHTSHASQESCDSALGELSSDDFSPPPLDWNPDPYAYLPPPFLLNINRPTPIPPHPLHLCHIFSTRPPHHLPCPFHSHLPPNTNQPPLLPNPQPVLSNFDGLSDQSRTSVTRVLPLTSSVGNSNLPPEPGGSKDKPILSGATPRKIRSRGTSRFSPYHGRHSSLSDVEPPNGDQDQSQCLSEELIAPSLPSQSAQPTVIHDTSTSEAC